MNVKIIIAIFWSDFLHISHAMAETIRPFYEILFRFENEKFENIFLQNYYIFLPNYTFFDQIGLTYMLHYMFKLFVAQKKQIIY